MLLARLLISVTFAIPATVVALWVTDGMNHGLWQGVPASAGIGTFCSAFVAWAWITKRGQEPWRGAFAGGVIGFVAHPVSAIVSICVIALMESLGLTPARPPGSTPGPQRIADWLMFAGFWTFWACLLGLISIGWLTVGIGAFVGFACDTIQRRMALRSESVVGEAQNRLAAALVSLAIVAACSAVGLTIVLLQQRSTPHQEVVFEKPIPDISDESQKPRSATETLSGATFVGYSDPTGDLSWTFTDRDFAITAGEGEIPAELKYELQVAPKARTIRGRWRMVDQLLILSEIQVDDQLAEQQDVTLPMYFIDGEMVIYAGDDYRFRPADKKL